MATVEISDDGERIIVDAGWNEKELVKLIPGSRWDKHAKKWSVPLSWPACLQLRGIFGQQLVVGPRLTNWSRIEVIRINEAMDYRDRLGDHLDDDGSSMYGFQRMDVAFSTLGGNVLIGHEMGLGKTISALKIIERSERNLLPALVICPNTTKTGWEKQTKRWFPGATAYVIRGSAVQRRKILTEAKKDKNALVIINLEAVRLFSRLAPYGSIRLAQCSECDSTSQRKPSVCEVHRRELNDFGFKTVVLDEAHRIKDPNSKQTRACWAVAHDDSVVRRIALTGTPIANHVGDVWSIMHFVEPKEWATKSKFVDRYAMMAWNVFGGLDIVGINPATRDEFHKIFDPRFRRMIKTQVAHQLPPVRRSQFWVDMTTKQTRAYKELETTLMAQLEDGSLLTSPNNLVLVTRLMQLAATYCDVEMVLSPKTCKDQIHWDRVNKQWIHGSRGTMACCQLNYEQVVTMIEPSPKLDALDEILDDTDKPVVIVAESRQLIELAAKRFDKNRKHEPYGLITGKQDEYERQRVLNAFQNGDLRAVLMTIKAGGTGIDGLQYADTIIFLQRSWSMIDNVQAEARIHRFGSEKHESVHVIDIITQDTIEQTKLYPALAAKHERLEEITRDRAKMSGTTDDLDREYDEIMRGFLL